jgi:hypothetical protein
MGLNVPADRLGGERDHVLSGGVARLELELQVHVIPLDGEAHVLKPAVTGRAFGDTAELVNLGQDPRYKFPRLPDRPEHEAGGAAHALIEQQRARAARLADQPGAPAVGSDQRCFGGGQRHVIVPLGEESVDAQRPRHAHRYLDCADEVLDAAVIAIQLGKGAGICDRSSGFGPRIEHMPAVIDRVAGGY